MRYGEKGRNVLIILIILIPGWLSHTDWLGEIGGFSISPEKRDYEIGLKLGGVYP